MTDSAMNTEKPSSSEVLTDCHVQLQTPGMYLQSHREKAGISQEQVAEALRISVAKLQALENERYEKLHQKPLSKATCGPTPGLWAGCG